MQVGNKAIEEMLKNADPQSRRVMANILTGKIVANIYCLSKDITEDREIPITDEEGKTVVYKIGKKKGQPKTETETITKRHGCKGRHIGIIYSNGRAEPVRDPDGNFYLRSTRKRLDGVIGCECWCGNDSRLARQEAGHMRFDGQPPTKEGLAKIFESIQKNPTVPQTKDGRTEIDGFAFEEYK